MPSETDPPDFDEPVPLPITGELDLHTFRPREIGELLPEYLRECVARGILEVRVIHGRGTGALKAGVLALLPRIPEVESMSPASPAHGGEGATWVRLRRCGAGHGGTEDTEKSDSPGTP
jgi:DNA-nicking Smr family endonuclease